MRPAALGPTRALAPVFAARVRVASFKVELVLRVARLARRGNTSLLLRGPRAMRVQR